MHAKMVVIGLAIDPQHKTPLVTLREHAARRHLELACPTHLQPPSVIGVGGGASSEDFGKYKM